MRKGKRCSLWVCMVCERYQTMVQASSNFMVKILDDRTDGKAYQ